MATSHHPVFSALNMTELTPATIDSAIGQDGLVGLFFWGLDCPNCEQAKESLLTEADEAQALGPTWYHVNVYEHMELATRFGLHGIPTFLFFRNGKRLGRISPYPGFAPFASAVSTLKKEPKGSS